MIELLPAIVQFAGTLLVAAVLSSSLSSVIYPTFRRCIARFDPSTRSLATLCFALIAPAVSVVTPLLYLVPDHAQLLVVQHCHGNHCGTHAPLVTARSIGSVGLLATASFLVFTFVAGVAYLAIVGRRRLAMLFALGEYKRKPNHLILDSDRLFAWCCGLLKQRIVISRALLDRLNPAQLQVILAHESAHAARFDNLRILATRWSTRLWRTRLRSQVLEDLVADCEQSCDAVALCTSADHSVFRQAVDVMAHEHAILHKEVVTPPGSRESDYRTSAATAGSDLRPSMAYLLVAFACAFQIAVTIVASHPIVETIAAAKIW